MLNNFLTIKAVYKIIIILYLKIPLKTYIDISINLIKLGDNKKDNCN